MLLSEARSEVDPSDDVRIVANIPGRYSLANLRNSRGDRRVIACRVVSLSSRTMLLAAPVKGKIGDRVLVHIDRLGKLEGSIHRLLEHGFVLNIQATAEERASLDAKIAWLEGIKNRKAPERRTDPRTIPANPHSKIILPDGRVEGCLVLDVSVSGAAISADSVPAIGSVLAIGSVVGRVVRHFGDGFAIKFIQRQHPDQVEAMVVLGG